MVITVAHSARKAPKLAQSEPDELLAIHGGALRVAALGIEPQYFIDPNHPARVDLRRRKRVPWDPEHRREVFWIPVGCGC